MVGIRLQDWPHNTTALGKCNLISYLEKILKCIVSASTEGENKCCLQKLSATSPAVEERTHKCARIST